MRIFTQRIAGATGVARRILRCRGRASVATPKLAGLKGATFSPPLATGQSAYFRTSSILPLDRTPHRGHLLRRAAAGFCDLLHRLEKVATGVRYRCRARGVEPAAILQLVLQVEAEEIGRALSPV